MDIAAFNASAKNQKKANQLLYKRWKQKPPKQLDDLFHQAHDTVFEQLDCLTCANCCKTTSPIWYQRDIERAAKAIRLKPGQFIEKYLRLDEDQDYVLKSSPCTFLNTDNTCSIYDDRPTACREYPHTNRKKMAQLMDLTFKNTLVCPAVLKITELVNAQLNNK